MLITLADVGEQIFNNCRASFATEAGARALRYTADLITRLRVTPQEALTYHVDDITDQFVAGRYAMAVERLLGQRPRVLFCWLNVAGRIVIATIPSSARP